MRLSRTYDALVAVALHIVPARASAQHVDILLAQNGDRLATGSFDFGTAETELPVRVPDRGTDRGG